MIHEVMFLNEPHYGAKVLLRERLIFREEGLAVATAMVGGCTFLGSAKMLKEKDVHVLALHYTVASKNI